MNLLSWMVWGFAGTVVLTTLMAGSQGAGMTRMNIPFLLGTIFTPDRDRAKPIGVVVHLINGWLFSLIYVAAFHTVEDASVVFGMAIGAIHALFVLAVGMPLLPAIHPRMATEQQGPTAVRQLEPPGFLALHYGVQTPISVFLAHLVFGAILGGFYELPQ
ncbi:MAG: hypothetical protein WD894_07980 [Pirellulales bacterium]